MRILYFIVGLWLMAVALADPVLDNRTLRYLDGNQLVWQRSYPQELGPISNPIEVAGVTYLGIGPEVYAFSHAGAVIGRADLPGFVTSIDATGGVVQATTAYKDYSERFTLNNLGTGLLVRERVVFPPDPKITGWLNLAARLVPSNKLAEAQQQDPTNSFLAFRVAQQATKKGDSYGELSAIRSTLEYSLPFPAWVQLASELDTAGYPDTANLALQRAREDAAMRGIDPEIAISRQVLATYGDPISYIETLLKQNRLSRVGAWLSYLRDLHPRFEDSQTLYTRYAAILEEQGRAGEAEEWRQFSRSLNTGTLYNLGPNGLSSVRDVARLLTLALAIALASALLLMLIKSWRTQGIATRALGGRYRSWLARPLSRARRVSLAYISFSERLMLTTLSVVLLLALVGWQWAGQVGVALHSSALNFGTYGGGWGNSTLEELNLRSNPDTTVLKALAAQLDGDDKTAREQYNQALPDACALNNLGAIAHKRGDDAQARENYRAALSRRPDLSSAMYNLDLNPATPSATFQHTYRVGEPRLCYPDQRSLARATTGDLSVTLRNNFLNPSQLIKETPSNSARLGWMIIAAAIFSAILGFSLLLPRTPIPLKETRPWLYRVLGLLMPGASLTANSWGAMLLLVWGIILAALVPLTKLLKYNYLPTSGASVQSWLLTALIISYVINTLAFIISEIRYARMMRHESQMSD